MIERIITNEKQQCKMFFLDMMSLEFGLEFVVNDLALCNALVLGH